MRLILILLPFLFCSSVFGQVWVQYAETKNKKFFFDSYRKYKNGDTVIVWDLNEVKFLKEDKKNSFSYKSAIFATEYNCRKKQKRTLNYKLLSGSMGSGNIISEKSLVSEWEDASNQTLGGKLYKHICE